MDLTSHSYARRAASFNQDTRERREIVCAACAIFVIATSQCRNEKRVCAVVCGDLQLLRMNCAIDSATVDGSFVVLEMCSPIDCSGVGSYQRQPYTLSCASRPKISRHQSEKFPHGSRSFIRSLPGQDILARDGFNLTILR